MSNILTDNTRTRRLAASVLAGVVLLGGMAGLSGTAMAAGAGTITLTAPAGETLANHSFSAYKIGDYSGYADANANGKIDGTNVTNAAGAQAWLKAALTKAGLSVDSAKGLDEAGTLAATTQAASLLAGDVIDVSQSGADLYAIWKRTKTEPAPVSTLPQTGSVIGLIGGLVAAVLLTGAGIAFKRRG